MINRIARVYGILSHSLEHASGYLNIHRVHIEVLNAIAKLEHERVISFRCIAIALRLIIKTEIHRIGRSQSSPYPVIHHGIKTNANRHERIGNKRIGTAVGINLAKLIEQVKSCSLIVYRIFRETMIYKDFLVLPFIPVGICLRI